jgi:gas vesicle protein
MRGQIEGENEHPEERTTMKTRTTLGILVAGLAALALLCGLPCGDAGREATAAPENKGQRTDWLHDAKWGVMFHYVQQWFGQFGSREQWNGAIQKFDTEGLAKQLEDAGAGYFMITARHMGLPLAPHKAFEDGKFPERDLIKDLADSMEKHNVKMMLYFACGGKEFAAKSAEVIEELSKRYGTKIKGWWIDNNPGDDKLQKAIADACRAGNPDALVAFSPPKGIARGSAYDDYTAGNEHGKVGNCPGRFVHNGLQWHVLRYMGHNWGGCCKQREKPRFSPDQVASFTKGVVDKGGVVTWDTPYNKQNGHIADECYGHLQAIGKALGTVKTKSP